MQIAAEHDRTRALVRTYVGRDGQDGSRDEHLARMLAAAERMAWRTHGQPEGAPWRRLVAAIRAELGNS